MSPSSPPLAASDLGLQIVPTRRALALLARLLLLGFVAVAIALAVTPWQQSVRGQGRVIAYAPLERQQTLEAPIAGRIVEWAVAEGDHVEAGALVAVISDNDPELVDRLGRRRDAAQERLDMARGVAEVRAQQVEALQSARDAAVAAAVSRVEMAVDRRAAAEQARDAAAAAVRAAELNLQRQKGLAAEGLASTRTLELAELAHQTAVADLERARASLRAAESEVRALRSERKRVEADTAAAIETARASLQSARADIASYGGDLVEREVDVARQHTMRVVAPRTGTILRLLAKQGGEFVSAGDAIAVLVPTTESRAVEIWVDGNDAPLVAPGREVRLQFEGWPAVQFVGWPSVAVGTFPGQIAFVDTAADAHGRFRAVVVPREGDEPWPSAGHLRQGVNANAWILLDRVALGFELWRQWNGFPQAIVAPPESAPSSGAGGSKS
ncbi:MAG: HlyD family efflux transporter periplasmic adaptor subunit [Nannocystaceae bacterium]